MKFRLYRTVLAVFAVLILSISGLSKVGSAQQDKGGGSGVQITPTRTDLSLLPGEQKDFDITVKNVTQGPIKVKMFFNDFESDGISGEPQIITDANRQLPNSMRKYVKGIQDFTLAKDESKETKITVDIPNNVSPGGYYGAVRFAAIPGGTDAASGDTQVSLTASVASLLFTEVAGNINEQIQIDNVKVCRFASNKLDAPVNTSGFGSTTSTKSRCEKSSGLFFSKPNVTSINIANKGNGFARPFGKVIVTRGGKEVFSYDINNSEPRGTILPATSRAFSDRIQGVNTFGRYTVTANVSYGQGGEVINKTASFWYIPTWVLITTLGLLVIVLGAAGMMYKKTKKSRKS